MTRYAVVTVLLISFAPHASAQAVPSGPPPGVSAGPASIVIPITSAKPPSGFYKSGGVLVGADGYFPFDTGSYLLGGYDGLTRFSGSFVMVPSGALSLPAYPSAAVVSEPSAPFYPPASSPSHGRLFHRR